MKPNILATSGLATGTWLVLAAFCFSNSVTDRFGIMPSAVAIGFLIEITRRRFPKTGLSATIVAVSTLTVVWGWTSPITGMSPVALSIALTGAWTTFCLAASRSHEALLFPKYLLGSTGLGLFCELADFDRLLKVLLWGYDNSAHLSALSQIYRYGGFLFAGHLPELFSFSNYYNGYPPLQAGSWSFLLSITNSNMTLGSESLVRYFAFFLLCTVIALCAVVAELVVVPPVISPVLRVFVRPSIFLLTFFSQMGFIFWSGFSSFLWALTVFVAYITCAQIIESHQKRVYVCMLGVLLVFYAYQLLAPIAIGVLCVEFIKASRSGLRPLISNVRFWGVGLSCAVLGIIFLAESLHTTNYLFHGGGIEPLTLTPLFFALGITVLFVVLFTQSPWNNSIALAASLFGSLWYLFLAALSRTRSDSVSYYPEKVGYTALLLSFVALCSTHVDKPRIQPNTLLSILRSAWAFMFLLPLILSVASSTSNFGYFSTWRAVTELDSDSGSFQDCLARANYTANQGLGIGSTKTVLYLTENFDSDVITRWVNSLNGTLNDATYSISIPHSGKVSLDVKVAENWLAQYPDSSLTILSGSPQALPNSIPRVDSIPFACP